MEPSFRYSSSLEYIIANADCLRGYMSGLYIWLDLLSIPQRNDTLKRLAVNSLYTHARQADALVIVEPDSEHQVIYLQITAQGELDGTVGFAIWLCMCPATRR